jgi:hypothetical protein
LTRGLKQMGLDDGQIAAAGRIVGEAIADRLPADVVSTITKKLPLLGT